MSSVGTMSFVSFRRCIVCTGRFSLTIKLHSPSFGFPPFSSLSSSSSSHITPPLNLISDLLTRECGFSSSQVTTVIRKCPRLLTNKSDHTARESIQFLKDSGFTENKLKIIILKDPCILQLKVDSQWKPKLEFLQKIGLAAQDVAHIIFYRPRLLHLSLENCLAPRILHLETLLGSKAHLCKALRRAPVLLTSNFEKQVNPKVEYLKNSIGIHEGSTVFVRALSVVINLSYESLEVKIKYMASLGLAEEEIVQILKTHPEVLQISTKKMKKKIDFLTRSAGLQPKIIALNSVILSLSLEKRLKPRYEVFKSLMTSPHAKSLPSLTGFFRLSERAYLAKFSQHNTQV